MESTSEARCSDNTEKKHFIYWGPETESGDYSGIITCTINLYLYVMYLAHQLHAHLDAFTSVA